MDLAERLRAGIATFASQNDQNAGGSDQETGSNQPSTHDDEGGDDHAMEIEDLLDLRRTTTQRNWMTTEKKSEKKTVKILELIILSRRNCRQVDRTKTFGRKVILVFLVLYIQICFRP
jgi:hypothetical protein